MHLLLMAIDLITDKITLVIIYSDALCTLLPGTSLHVQSPHVLERFKGGFMGNGEELSVVAPA